MDNRTLGEIAFEAKDMLTEILKKCQSRHFISIEHARAYRAAMLTNCMKALGIDAPSVFDLSIDGDAAAMRFDDILVKNKVVIEQRRQGGQRPSWEAGLFVYKTGELAYFISIIFPHGDEFIVRTNAPEDIV